MDFGADIENLKGIGPKTAEILRKSGIKTVRDFFYNLPRDYEDFAAPEKISDIAPGKVTIRGYVTATKSHQARRRRLTITEAVIRDDSGFLKAVWFNQAYRVKQLVPEKEYYFRGNFELKNGRFTLMSPSVAEVSEVDFTSTICPIYVAHGRVKSADFKRLIKKSRDKFARIPDLLPTVKPGTRRDALFNAHFPDSHKIIKNARDYLAYEELFELILASKLNRLENEKLKATPIPFDVEKVREFVSSLPFKLTNAQRVAAMAIFKNMEKDQPMNRLLQGDVGSGKTVVAAMSALMACASGGQVALLAPTSILASQHYESISKLLKRFGIKVALLTGATKNKPALKKAIASGEINFVIGTHALLTDDTEFKNLTLVVIDEQHRFGVEQRQKIMFKSPGDLAPHLLMMTATPIPRSLQLTIFGDLDVSILDELPSGRQKIDTKILPETEIKDTLYPRIRETLAKGQQIYWITKAIEDNPRSETTSVKSRFEKLKRDFPDVEIEFLHGRMKPAEKDAVMEKFASGETKILVSTTVVEVGVNVPNSTVMIIENAEGYGLAQIHQLRGRVGRGSEKSFCYLLTSGDIVPTKRLLELEKSSDGFYLAEVDLKMRGPGEIYGSLQHGALDLRIASLSDTRLISRAQQDAELFLKNPENLVKYKELMGNIAKYQQLTTLN